jgi:hypothetical protein
MVRTARTSQQAVANTAPVLPSLSESSCAYFSLMRKRRCFKYQKCWEERERQTD